MPATLITGEARPRREAAAPDGGAGAVLTREEVAAMLKVDVSTFDRRELALTLAGFPNRLPALGKSVRYARRAVLAWIEGAGQSAPAGSVAAELAEMDNRAAEIARGAGPRRQPPAAARK